MIIKLNRESIDATILVNIDDNYIDTDEIEFEENSDEITYKITGYIKYGSYNKDINVKVTGKFDRDQFIEDVHSIQMFGSAVEPIKDRNPKLDLAISNNFETLEDIARFFNFYRKENIKSNLLISDYDFLRRCPKALEVAKQYLKGSDPTLPSDYFDDIENVIDELSDIYSDEIDFSWVTPKNREIVFNDVKSYCDSKATYKELLNKISSCYVEIRPSCH